MEVEYKNVGFGYEVNNMIFRNISVKFKSGDIVSVIGNNGNGKTTFLNLLFGVWDNYEGNILINKKEIRDYSRVEMKKLVGICFQKAPIFIDTIFNNIRLGNEAITYEKVLFLCNKYQLIQEANIKQALEKYLDNNHGLSVGQEQKIGILRLLCQDTPIMIFDEPTSNLDETSRNVFADDIRKIGKEKIVFIISHNKEFANITNAIFDTNHWKLMS